MVVNFVKMEGLGNDFVIIDLREKSFHLLQHDVCRIADRRFGVGCDQVLLIDKAESELADFSYRVFNSDGTSAAHCGNGLRCVMSYLSRRKDIEKKACVEIGAELYFAQVLPGDIIKVSMGKPDFDVRKIGLSADYVQNSYKFNMGDQVMEFGAVSMGNPHAVIEVASLQDYDVASVGAEIQNKAGFENGVNVGFVEFQTESTISLKVWERGVGETPACGTGACAAVAVGVKWGKLNSIVKVRQAGGELAIEWDPEKDDNLTMTGPANYVFEGTILI